MSLTGIFENELKTYLPKIALLIVFEVNCYLGAVDFKELK